MNARVRTTISLPPEILEIFKRMAAASNMSVSRAMGEWLVDTADAAEMIVGKMEEVKKAPMKVMRELQAMISAASTQVDMDIAKVRQMTTASVRAASPPAAAVGPAPSSNTGLKSPEKGKKGAKPL